MTVTIELTPELARRLKEEASRHGQEPSEFVRRTVEEKLTTSGLSGDEQPAENPLYAGLPRRDPSELLELARQQGAPLAARFEDLQADFWPEDESIDEFLATLREWRREGRKHRKR